MIRLYSKLDCPFCEIMKDKLDEAKVKYQTIDIDQDDDAKMYIKARGHRTVPVLYYENQHLNTKDTIKYSIEELKNIVDSAQHKEWPWQDSGIEMGL